MMEYESLFKAARQAGTLLAETETERLGRTLMHAAQLLRTHTPRLLEANARDLEAMAPDSPLRDRLRLTPERIAAIAADHAVPDTALPVFDLDDTAAIADFVVAITGLTKPA